MAGTIDRYQEEKRIGKATSASVKSALKSKIKETTKSKTGTAERTASSRAVFKNQRLQRITLQAPHYIFKQHFGFEGTKKNGVNMRLAKTNVINKVLDGTNILENLADALSNLRSEEVESLIRI